jgi:hypothetical protein
MRGSSTLRGELGQTGHMLAMTLGILFTGCAVLGLAWDWYRHPFE